MKIAVISSPVAISEEASIMNALFEAGLELLHLRKPSYSKKELMDLTLQIDERFRQRLVLHTHHQIAENLGIQRIHFPEAIRLYTSDHELKKWRSRNYTLSTSIHAIEHYATLSNHFSYTFLGPVFESISKENYGPSIENLTTLKFVKRPIEIIAIGGITPEKFQDLKNASFDGAALLGAIWSSPEKATEIFHLCQQSANM